jgi:pyrrolidone-carboxylate peptidase
MKLLIFLGLIPTTLWGKPLVLVSYFDAFNRAPFNNSQRIALALEQRLNRDSSPVQLKLCPLNTIFDQAYAQTEDCLKALEQSPVMVLGLGEATCELKLEAMMRNKDKTVAADNAGTHRHMRTIIPGAPEVLGLKYPLPQMYCALNSTERNNLTVSNHAGSFVCNNTAYQMSHYYSELQYGFIHVPANNCANLVRKTELAINSLEKMILKGATYLLDNDAPQRLPTKKDELKILRRQTSDECENEYYRKLKGADEKRIIFTGLMN